MLGEASRLLLACRISSLPRLARNTCAHLAHLSLISLLELGSLLARLPPEARGVVVVAKLGLADTVDALAGGDPLAVVASRVIGPVNAAVGEP